MKKLSLVSLACKNVWRQKSRSWGIGGVACVCALVLLCLSFCVLVTAKQVEMANVQIGSMEQSEQLTGTNGWEAQQAGDLQENITAPLSVALTGMKLLVAFLWLGALVAVSAITTVVLPERYREFGMYRMLGYRSGQLAKLLFLESILLGVAGSMLGGAVGLVVIFLGGEWLGSLVGLASVSYTLLEPLQLAAASILASALVGPIASVFFACRTASKPVVGLLATRR